MLRRMLIGLTEAEIQQLPAMVDLQVAGLAFGLGRTKSFAMAKAGEFPVPVHRFGTRAYRVATADIRKLLGMRAV
jgi:hypothetical protein